MDRPRFWASLEATYSLEDVPEFDPDAEITSPRSVEACEIEGITVEELVYTPFAEFDLPGLEPQVVTMRHDFHEARRQDLLTVGRHRRQALILGEDVGGTLKLDLAPPTSPTALTTSRSVGNLSATMGSTSPKSPKQHKNTGLGATAKAVKEVVTLNRPLSPGLITPGDRNPYAGYKAPGSPPGIAPFPNTYDFFIEWQKELDPFKPVDRSEKEDTSELGSSVVNSPNTSQVLDFPSSGSMPARDLVDLAANTQANGLNGTGDVAMDTTAGSAELGMSISEEGTIKRANKGEKQPLGKAFTRTVPDEQVFMAQLEAMRTCNGTDRVEEDFAKNTENHLVTLRNDHEKARQAEQGNDKLTVKWRNDMQEATFDRLLGDYFDNRGKRDHREHHSRPADRPRNIKAEARHQIVFENNAVAMKAMVNKRVNYLETQTEKHHKRIEHIANDNIQTKMRCAQTTMAERLRWREFHHVNVTVKGQRYEEEKLRMFKEREAYMAKRLAVADGSGKLRKELHRIRHINRQMNEEMRARKEAYQLRIKKAELDEWKQGINEAAVRAARPKMASNLASSWTMSPASMQKSQSQGSLAMSRSVPTHMASPLASSLQGSPTRVFSSWYRHG